MAFLTDRSFTTGVTLQDLIHIVNPIDLSQGNPAGSSYKATIQQVSDVLLPIFTGTSLYEVGSGVDSTQRVGVGADASGDYSLVGGGTGNTASGDYSFVGGGSGNTILDVYSVIDGGYGNTTSSYYLSKGNNFIGSGCLNTISGCYGNSSIVGGWKNNLIDDNSGSIIGGGFSNTSYGGRRSAIVGGTRLPNSSVF